MTLNETGSLIVDAAFTVHKLLGPGLLESAYESCLIFELMERGMTIESQAPMPLIYKNLKLGIGYRADIKVNHCILIEIKAVEALNSVHLAQMLTYLKIANYKLGYLINLIQQH